MEEFRNVPLIYKEFDNLIANWPKSYLYILLQQTVSQWQMRMTRLRGGHPTVTLVHTGWAVLVKKVFVI